MNELFTDDDGKKYAAEDIRTALLEIGVDDCSTLFIHADVMFGIPARGFKRKEYLDILYHIVDDLGIENLIIPTFTYSFCNHEDFDVVHSRTSMGAFNEYIRKLKGRYRSMDPLLSVSVPKRLQPQFENFGEHSLGENSGLDIIHHMDGVKFLFFGADMANCFTYVHYVEKMLDVPYRFDMPFEGNIIDCNGNMLKRKQFIHTQCLGVKVPERYGNFEEELAEKGFLRRKRLGNKYVSCLNEKDAYREICERIHRDINYFLEKPFEEQDLVHQYTYNYKQSRITHC